MTEKEKMLNEQLYLSSHPELENMRRKARQLIRAFNQSTEEEAELRTQILKELFNSTGEQLYMEPPLRVDYGCNISIGENFYANFDTIILDVARVTIGKNVMFAPRVGIFTASHPIDAGVRVRGLEFGQEVTIADNTWIGANAIINPGVRIGSNTIIGSGSVVTKNIPDGVIAVGNPCRVLREITDADRQHWEALESDYYGSAKK
ncbi:MAG: sugar O-acetyltransferase [Turicibacter sp.]|nr:sugar O-acetyltransferase [Turicibacter sp.]